MLAIHCGQTDEGIFLLQGTRCALKDRWHLSSLVDSTLDPYHPVVIMPHGLSFLIRGLSSLYRAAHGQPYISFTTMQIPELGEHYFRYGSSFPFRLALQDAGFL